MAPPFDQAVMVDWSASSSPRTGRDSIWAGVRRRGAGRSVVVNPPTRLAATCSTRPWPRGAAP
jgi:precorrin-8X/cobalt-precorrin-8 methylmutase